MIALVDYGAGNLTSVLKGFAAVGANIRTIRSVDGLDGAAGIVIPGVGHFNATASLDESWRGAIGRAVERSVPLLGICLGLQWLFEGSDEAPDLPGIGLMQGRCFRLSGDVKVPHVGWNTLETGARRSRLLEGVPTQASAYFTHSYAAPVGPDTVAVTTHGVPFASAVERAAIFGAQFHPEKSGHTGLKMLENFLRVVQTGGRSC
ncbi:MAG: imidazole glycerol phosphate synthase subunit HisH [Acidobacteria bacterium]|nr:imidazole glycerol phosphate synthase subunit HisH [Acidobacteriota bacterium]